MATRHRLVTPPAVEPVTLAEAKTHVRVDHDASDGELTRHIEAARQICETWTRRAFIEQVWETTFDYGVVPDVDYVLARRPALQVVQVATYDAAGAETVWGGSNYVLDGDVLRVLQAAGGWPQGTREHAPLAIRWKAGYLLGGTNEEKQAAVPDGIKDGILEVVRAAFEREPVRFTRAAKEHLAPFRKFGGSR